MIDPTQINYGQLAAVAKDGSPLLLQALGRLYGLGPGERRAAFGSDGSGVPGWAWAALALGVGIVVGVRIQKNFPRHVPSLIQGD